METSGFSKGITEEKINSFFFYSLHNIVHTQTQKSLMISFTYHSQNLRTPILESAFQINFLLFQIKIK